MLGVSNDLLHASHGVSLVLVMTVRIVYLSSYSDWCFLYQEWLPIFSYRKVTLHVLINAILVVPLQDCFSEKFLHGLFCALPARLGKAVMCNFCCGQLQILVGLICYDSFLRISLTTSSISVSLHTYVYGDRLEGLK